MLYVVIGLLLLAVIVLGLSSGMQSYATAQQAQAQIETARAAQISATGNVISIFITLVVVIVIIALLAAVLFYFYKKNMQPRASIPQPRRSSAAIHAEPDPQLNMERVSKMLELRVMMSLLDKLDGPRDRTDRPSLPDGSDRDARDDLPSWLR